MAPEGIKFHFMVACIAIATLLGMSSGHFTIGRGLHKWTKQPRPWQRHEMDGSLVPRRLFAEKKINVAGKNAAEKENQLATEKEDDIRVKDHPYSILGSKEDKPGIKANFPKVEKAVGKGSQQIRSGNQRMRWIRSKFVPHPFKAKKIRDLQH